ncbi:cholinesterase-like [Bicyclus anynana]|uniref:Carboxylic ester hydrolase n=1 Tax=Bicyclus anynana TaxID=110368 RepID=A0ABM3LPV1_BICAN|nr:cholinesterase-like [Bicyclus anynana]
MDHDVDDVVDSDQVDSDREDSDREDSDREDSDSEDSDPEDSDPEDSDQEDNDQEDKEVDSPEEDQGIGSVEHCMVVVSMSADAVVQLDELQSSNVPSLPYPKFEQVFNAYDDSAVCPQREEFNLTITGTLDCLNLNIYAPNKASPQNKVPVLALIYGGGFNVGFAGRFLYGPKFLVRHDIILVTINYRLGPYGFMCLDTPEVPGNQGLKDQLLALRWVKNNIAAFGGDADKITLMGTSAGSVSVELHLMSGQEKLYNQIITQSTSALSPLAEPFSDKAAPLKIADKLGYKTNNISDALEFLAKRDPKVIIATSIDLSLIFVTCVEKTFDGVESITTVHPLQADIKDVKNMKVLAGFNNKEQLVQSATRPADTFRDLNVFKFLALGFDVDENFQVMEDIVRRFYVGKRKEYYVITYVISIVLVSKSSQMYCFIDILPFY